jgi:hypothetical protein
MGVAMMMNMAMMMIVRRVLPAHGVAHARLALAGAPGKRRPVFRLIVALALGLAACAARARVLRVDVTDRHPVMGGAPFGSAGSYEWLAGRILFAVDPANRFDRPIADLDLADRDAAGRVEFSADFALLRPVEPGRGNGTVLVEVPNRGGRGVLYVMQGGTPAYTPARASDFGDGWLLRQGYAVGWIGWQWDAPAGHMGLRAPRAHGPGGATLSGWVRDDFTLPYWRGEIPLGHIIEGRMGGTEYAVSDPDDPRNRLSVRDAPYGPRQPIPRDRWSFGADRRSLRLRGGFQPGRIYELIYRARDPAVAGLGLAAVRDFASAFKSGNTVLGSAQRVYALGISQCGRFLRQMLYQGFDADESGRLAYDGILAHVAGAGRGSFNQRFAQPSRDAQPMSSLYYPTDVFPFTALPETDPETGRTAGLLDATRAEGLAPKVFLSNTSYEYWGRVAALIHTTPDGARDMAQPANVRVYFWPGEEHFAYRFPAVKGAGDLAGQNLINPNPSRWLWRAMLANLDAWVRTGEAPPPSCAPRIADGSLVPLARWRFPALPGVRLPTAANRAWRLDFSREPPVPGEPYPVLVPQADADGNDRGGVRIPELAVPLATYTGWNLRDPSIGAPDRRASFIGSYLPFPRTEAERRGAGDPRLSLAERYRGKADYLDRYRRAVLQLVRERWALPEDAGALMARGAQEWDAAQTGGP